MLPRIGARLRLALTVFLIDRLAHKKIQEGFTPLLQATAAYLQSRKVVLECHVSGKPTTEAQRMRYSENAEAFYDLSWDSSDPLVRLAQDHITLKRLWIVHKLRD